MTDEYSLTVRREIVAPAEDLFDAWLDARSLASWLRPAGFRETRAEVDPREGGEFRIVMVGDESSVVHVGTYHEIDRPRRLVFTWASPATRFRDSIVTVTFERKGEDTLVSLKHSNLPDDEYGHLHEGGWNRCLDVFGDQFRTGYGR